MKYPDPKRPALPTFGIAHRRSISQLAPKLPGLQDTMRAAREAHVSASYDIASTDRLVRTRTGLGGTGDSHLYTAQQLQSQRENARELIRNHPILGQMVRRFADNVLGGGLVIDPETKSKPWNKKAQKLWEDWCCDPSQCDLARRRTFNELERLALLHATIDGDVWPVMDASGRVKVIEAEYVSGYREPTDAKHGVMHGVELHRDTDEQLAVWIRKKNHVRDTRQRRQWASDSLTEDMQRVEVRLPDGTRQVIPILHEDSRVSVNRGVTFLAPVFARASAYDDTEWAQLVGIQIAACVAVFIQSEYPTGLGAQSTETDGDYTAALEELVPGLIARLRPGEKIGTVEPKGPGQNIQDQLMHTVREIGLQLDMPLSLSILSTERTNFHGYRGEISEARKSFSRRQQVFGRAFRGEVYKRKVAGWIAEGKLKARPDQFAYRIQGPSWPYVDPSKDAQADGVRLETGATSLRRLHRERGQDWDRVAIEIVEDNKLLIEAAAKAAAELGVSYPDAGIHWRDLANRAAPLGVPIQVQQDTPQSSDDPEPEEPAE